MAAVFDFNLAWKVHHENALRVIFGAKVAFANTVKAVVSHCFTTIGVYA